MQRPCSFTGPGSNVCVFVVQPMAVAQTIQTGRSTLYYPHDSHRCFCVRLLAGQSLAERSRSELLPVDHRPLCRHHRSPNRQSPFPLWDGQLIDSRRRRKRKTLAGNHWGGVLVLLRRYDCRGPIASIPCPISPMSKQWQLRHQSSSLSVRRLAAPAAIGSRHSSHGRHHRHLRWCKGLLRGLSMKMTMITRAAESEAEAEVACSPGLRSVSGASISSSCGWCSQRRGTAPHRLWMDSHDSRGWQYEQRRHHFRKKRKLLDDINE